MEIALEAAMAAEGSSAAAAGLGMTALACSWLSSGHRQVCTGMAFP